MENNEQNKFFDLSANPSSPTKSASSLKPSPKNSKHGADADGGQQVGPKLTNSELLLSKWLSLTGDIRDSGVDVRMSESGSGVMVILGGTRLCRKHNLIYVGQTCPIC